MAISARKSKILVDAFDFTGDTSSIEVNTSSSTQDATALGDTGTVEVITTVAGTITQNGYFNGVGAGELEKELYDRFATGSAHVAALFGTDDTDCPAYVLPATQANNLTIAAPVDGVITVNGGWGSGTGIKRGIRIYSGTISATGGTTAYDLGAAGSAGGWGYLFVQAITGTATSAEIDIESSATEGGTYASEGTFTFSATGDYALDMSGTVNRWLRVNCTSLGGATNFTVVVIAAVSGVTM